LIKEGLGDWAIRKSLEFLGNEGCAQIDSVNYASPKGKKALQFGRNGRLFLRKSISKSNLQIKILSLLAPLQRRVLEKLTKHHRSIYYFSLYETRKLLPNPAVHTEYALERLSKLGLVKAVKIGNVMFYTEPKHASRLRNQGKKALLEDKAEFVVVHLLHELIMNLYIKF
ncbi:MAG: hypothetical protein Q6361_07825, partial [Candidatus Hermodarchaeota archaeon]|nr:hypothetical protein [Candidatus Hermodarchaeota archaeon]